jgi:ATP-dependent DNA helicase RecG
MSEDQNAEWKTSWRDDYLKWICGFANAQGGVLELGRNDEGQVVGLEDASRLLEELPNKLRDLLGIVADINLLKENGKPYLRVVVEPYPVPISYRGEYHYRTGSTKQVLKGAALDRFLLGKTGKRWDAVPVPGVAVGDLDASVLARFRERAARTKRLGADAFAEDDPGLIEKLRLAEDRYLKRAAVLLFHPDPERFFNGASVKIGYFESETDLRFHDEVHGDLFTQVSTTMDLLLTRYLKAGISYEGIQRVETYPVPESALRETVLNAVVHRDYAVAAPIQIRVFPDRLRIWKPGELPENWTLKKLVGQHPSRPFNPDVANAFFRAGEIEAWGRGVHRVFEACREAGTPEPLIEVVPGELWVEFPFSEAYLDSVGAVNPEEAGREPSGKTSGKTPVKTPVKAPVKTPVKILQLLAANPDMTLAEVAESTGRSLRAVERASARLVKDGRLRYVGPRKGGHWEVIGGADE